MARPRRAIHISAAGALKTHTCPHCDTLVGVVFAADDASPSDVRCVRCWRAAGYKVHYIRAADLETAARRAEQRRTRKAVNDAQG